MLVTIFGVFFIFFMTTLGSALVFIFKGKNKNKLNLLFLGFASGIMFAASIWSLILPALDACDNYGNFKIFPTLIGFLLGCEFLILINKIVNKIDINCDNKSKNGLNRSTKLFLAVTIHNIPEGLAVGFAFGVAFVIGTSSALVSALGLAVGIGIQNFPEGIAVALPIKTATGSNKKAFLYGMLSGSVEPVFACVGFYLASVIEILQPWLLSFAAGAMIFVVVEDLIPESQNEKEQHFGTYGFVFGFVLMMVLDVLL